MIAPFPQAGLSYLAGALTTLSPCVLPVLPFVVGGAMQSRKSAPLWISAGLISAFVAIGWSLAAFGSFLGVDPKIIRWIAGAALAGSGLILLVPKFQDSVRSVLTPMSCRAENHLKKAGYAGAAGYFATGAFLGAVWSPCSGPTLGAAISLAAQEGGGWRSGGLLLCFSLGAVTPLLAIAYGAKGLIHRKRRSILQGVDLSKKVLGALMIVVGLAIVCGADKRVEAFLVNAMPDAWIDLTTRF